MPDYSQIATAVISFLLGSGGLIAYLKFKREGEIESRTFAEKEREHLIAEVDRLNKAVSATSSRIIPSNLPCWIKDSERKYIDINHAWEIQIGTRIGVHKRDVIGKTVFEIFKEFPDFAKLLNEIDDEAANTGGVAIREGVCFPKTSEPKIVIKEIVVHDILDQAIFKGMAIPDNQSKKE